MARSTSKRRTSGAASSDATWWDRQSDAVQHGLCLALLVAVIVAFFAPVLFSGKTIVGGDTVNWRAMAEAMIDHREETGQEPLWSPNAFAGMPGYLISFPKKIPQLDTLVSLLRPLLWPASHALVLFLGAYLLVTYLTRNKLAAVLAACAYGLTTYLPIILVAGHNTKFIALSYAPWLVLAFAYALRKPKLLSGLLFAIALGLNLRADHVQITYYVAFMLGLWWLVEGVGAARKGRWKPFLQSTGWMALGSMLALAMVAQPYLSISEYKAFSIRGAASGGAAGEGALAWDYAMGWSQGVGELVTLLIADAYGGGEVYWGPKPFTAGPHYVGGTVLLLAVLALWRVRKNVVWALGLGTGLMLLFSLGEHFPLLNRPMFDYFPLFDAFRVPETWLVIVALALALLAGFGIRHVVRREDTLEAEAAKTKRIYIASGGMIGVVLLLLLFQSSLFDFERPNEYQQAVQQIATSNNVSPSDPRVAQTAERYISQVKTDRKERFSDDAQRTLLFLALAGGVLVAYRRTWIPGWVLQLALALLVIVDLWGVDRRYFSEDDLRRAQAPEDLIAQYDFDQYILEQRAQAGGPGAFRVLSLESGNPMVNARPSYFYESVGGYHGAKLRLYQDYIDHIFIDQRGLPSENALDLLNVRYVVARGTLPGTEPVFQSEQTGQVVFRNPDAVPRAFLVGNVEVINAPEAMWSRIQQPGFEPRQTALLAEAIDFNPVPVDSASTAQVILEDYGPREIRWSVATDAPRLLVVSEVYYPAGWTAYVDGEPEPILRANYLLRAVPIPEGDHDVVMRFEPASYTRGLWISGIATALTYGGVLVLLGLTWRRRKEPHAPDDESENGATDD